EDQQRPHAVVGEALPGFGKEQYEQAPRVPQDGLLFFFGVRIRGHRAPFPCVLQEAYSMARLSGRFRGGKLVVASGIEPPTTSMSRRCSTTELRDYTVAWPRRAGKD